MTILTALATLLMPLDAAESPAPVAVDSRPALTTVAAVRQLSAEEARRVHPVKIRGVVTLRSLNSLMYVQDDTGGIYVTPRGLPPRQPEAGTLVEIEGVTTFGRFSPFLAGRGGGGVHVRTLGKAPLPAAPRLSIDQLADPRWQNQWIEVTGVVRSVRSEELYRGYADGVVVTLASSSQRMAAVVLVRQSEGHVPADSLVGAEVSARGVYGAIFSAQGRFLGMHLWLSSFEDIEVQQEEAVEPWASPLQRVGSLLQFDARQSPLRRVHVAGVVSQVVEGKGFFLQEQDAGLWVRTADPPQVQPGDTVEVVGFPAVGDWNPILEDATYRVRGSQPLAEPIPITPGMAASGDHDGQRVCLNGRLLEVSRSPEENVLVVQTDGRAVLARMPIADPMPPIREGSLLRLTGICANRRSPDFLRELSTHVGREIRPESFVLLLGGPTAIRVLREPSWWTAPRLLATLAAVLTATVGALIWVVSLRRQVRLQTEIIRGQSQREATLEERGRIAHELHDTLEQELAGLGLQLDTASAKWDESPALARQTLETARALLRHSRTEARRSILDLRASALERGDLAVALEEAADMLAAGQAVRIVVRCEGPRRRLPGVTETNLLRIGQEAIANAIKHARAEKIDVSLAFFPDRVTLSIRDNGIGFDAVQATSLTGGHLGLLGMCQRAERMRAALCIDSQPGRGTEIRVEVKTPGEGT
jgi:signal transduction histidine kinase